MVEANVQQTQDDLAALHRRLEALVKRDILAGISEATNSQGVSDGGMGNAMKAYLNDNGAPAAGIPQREFMRPGIERNAEEIQQELRKAAVAHLEMDDRRVEQHMENAGQSAVNGMREEITSGDLDSGGRQLSEVTLRLRREGRWRNGSRSAPSDSEAPLIETGAMRQALTYVIE